MQPLAQARRQIDGIRARARRRASASRTSSRCTASTSRRKLRGGLLDAFTPKDAAAGLPRARRGRHEARDRKRQRPDPHERGIPPRPGRAHGSAASPSIRSRRDIRRSSLANVLQRRARQGAAGATTSGWTSLAARRGATSLRSRNSHGVQGRAVLDERPSSGPPDTARSATVARASDRGSARGPTGAAAGTGRVTVTVSLSAPDAQRRRLPASFGTRAPKRSAVFAAFGKRDVVHGEHAIPGGQPELPEGLGRLADDQLSLDDRELGPLPPPDRRPCGPPLPGVYRTPIVARTSANGSSATPLT